MLLVDHHLTTSYSGHALFAVYLLQALERGRYELGPRENTVLYFDSPFNLTPLTPLDPLTPVDRRS